MKPRCNTLPLSWIIVPAVAFSSLALYENEVNVANPFDTLTECGYLVITPDSLEKAASNLALSRFFDALSSTSIVRPHALKLADM
jgi:hypothetical protein